MQEWNFTFEMGEMVEKFQPELGEILAELRAELGYKSQVDLADAAGIDVRTLSALENGGTVQLGKLAAVCTKLDVTIEEIKRRAAERRRSSAFSIETPRKESQVQSKHWLKGVVDKFAEVDAEVEALFGKLNSPTRSTGVVEFSSRRLVASLTALGIPPEVVFRLLDKLPQTLTRFVSDFEQMSTNHVRSAVAQQISELSFEDIADTDVFRLKMEVSLEDGGGGGETDTTMVEDIKFDWASRYARRYGNPNQIMSILEDNGSSKKLDYAFIKGELIPQALERILGSDFRVEDRGLVSPTVVAEMARSTLEEFRRLGMYSLRYKTALLLTEDIALNPPHPWVISKETRERTIEYDFERAQANLDGLEDSRDTPVFSIKHRFSEVVHHLCSAILGTYNGFLGHKHASSLGVLRHWLTMQDDNPVLWKRCDLHLIESDLHACAIARQDFNALLKKMDTTLSLRTVPPKSDLVSKALALQIVAEKLFDRRIRMQQLDLALSKRSSGSDATLIELIPEIVFSCFGARKVFPLKDRIENRTIGYSATPAFGGTVLSGRQPLCLFIFAAGFDGKAAEEAVATAVDQLNAHRMSDTCLIMCAQSPSPEFLSVVHVAEVGLRGNQILRVFTMEQLRQKRRAYRTVAEFIDDVFAGD